MATGDEGEAYLAPKHSEKVVAVYGTFGGATVLIDGTLNPASNSYDANFWFPARDVNLADITFTAAGHELVLDHFYGIAPRVTGGAGVDVDVYLLLMRSC